MTKGLIKKCTLTGTGHGHGVSLSTEVVFFTATEQRPLMVRKTVRRAFWTLRISQHGLVEARLAHWKQERQSDGWVVLLTRQEKHFLHIAKNNRGWSDDESKVGFTPDAARSLETSKNAEVSLKGREREPRLWGKSIKSNPRLSVF